jgi:integrase/recombinase XerD
VEESIDQFLLYLATERGLSANYQLSTRRSLEAFTSWLTSRAGVEKLADIEPGHFADYLTWRKRSGLAAASIKLEAVALRIFFRFLLGRKILATNPAENLPIPRVEKFLPETLTFPAIAVCSKASAKKTPLGLPRPGDL